MHQIDGICFLIFAERGLWNRFVPSLDGYIQDRLNNPVHVPGHGTIKALRLEAPPAELLRRWVAGILATLPGAMSFLVPNPNSYRRQVELTGPPMTVTWGEDNKSAALRTVEERGVRFVRMWFTDVLGQLKSFAITPAELENALEEGMTFDGSAIEGFSRVQESDMLAMPDPNTFGGPVQIRRAGEPEWTDMPLSHGNSQQSRGLGLADMVRAERSGRPHRASGDLALHVLEVMERLQLAAERGSHQEVASTLDRPAPLPPGLLDDATGD